MANTGWLNQNANRDWPFIQRSQPVTQYAPDEAGSDSLSLYLDLPHEAIVDFGAILDIDAEYDESAGHRVYLSRIARPDGTTYTFEFRPTSPAAAMASVTFTRQVSDPENTISWEESVEDGSTSAELSCPVEPRWRAFLVTGDVTSLDDLLAVGESLDFPQNLWIVEPSRIQNLAATYLRACHLANYARTLVTAAPGCSNSASSQDADELIINTYCLQGEIQWREGFNASIRQDNFDNALVIGAGVGSGAGEPCEEVPVFVGETAPVGSPFLSGGPGCSTIVKSINGVSGRRLFITGGAGIRVFADLSAENTLVVERSLEDFAFCVDPTPEASSSSLTEGGG